MDSSNAPLKNRFSDRRETSNVDLPDPELPTMRTDAPNRGIACASLAGGFLILSFRVAIGLISHPFSALVIFSLFNILFLKDVTATSLDLGL